MRLVWIAAALAMAGNVFVIIAVVNERRMRFGATGMALWILGLIAYIISAVIS